MRKEAKEMRAILVCKAEWVIQDLEEHRETLALLDEMVLMELLDFLEPKVQRGPQVHQESTASRESLVQEVFRVLEVQRAKRVTLVPQELQVSAVPLDPLVPQDHKGM